MMKELIKSFENLHDDEKTRVIIIEGEGKGFCAGHNLKEINSLKGKPEYLKLFTLCSDLMMKIINNNKPVIAKIHGSAYAARCQLVATCDLALSTNDAIFATPYGLAALNSAVSLVGNLVCMPYASTEPEKMNLLSLGRTLRAASAILTTPRKFTLNTSVV